MPAYVLIDLVEIHDPETFGAYREAVGPVVDGFGGRYLVAGGEATVEEGAPTVHLPVLIEFPGAEAARRWLESDKYAPLRAIRQRSATANVSILSGLA